MISMSDQYRKSGAPEDFAGPIQIHEVPLAGMGRVLEEIHQITYSVQRLVGGDIWAKEGSGLYRAEADAMLRNLRILNPTLKYRVLATHTVMVLHCDGSFGE